MTILATESNRFSTVVKHEFCPEKKFCRDVLTVYDAAATFKVGAVLGKFVASPTGTAAAVAGNTGNGTMGAVTVTSNKNLQLGVYNLTIVKAAANAGDFVVTDTAGDVVGNGTVAVAFSQAGIAFTLADGATDFVVGDAFTITIAGTEKYKLVEATATDGSEIASAVYIADVNGNSYDLAVTANTDTTVLALTRGPAIVSKSGLTYGASVNTDAEKAALYAQLKAVGIVAETAA
jgi:hypothetical protein